MYIFKITIEKKEKDRKKKKKKKKKKKEKTEDVNKDVLLVKGIKRESQED